LAYNCNTLNTPYCLIDTPNLNSPPEKPIYQFLPCNSCPSIKWTLSSKLNYGNHKASSSANFQVASAGVKHVQWMSIWVAACWFFLTIHRSSIACGRRRGLEGRVGNMVCTFLFPTFFFNKDTWNTRWMVVEAGNFSLYATIPILAKTSYGPYYFEANFWDCL